MTDDEYTALTIMREGGVLAAIGKWKPVLESLVAQGLAARHDQFNHTATPAGVDASAEREGADILAVIDANNRAYRERHAVTIDHQPLTLGEAAEKFKDVPPVLLDRKY